MSRNTEHQFIPTDTGQVVALLTALYEQINELHDQYRQIAPSYGVDFVYSLTACVDLLMGILDQPASSAT